jgi:hypothetical protein
MEDQWKTSTPTPSSPKKPEVVYLAPGQQWKTFSQVEADLKAITDAGYSKVCLFDLKSIQGYPDPRYVPLLRRYADGGLEITVYVQEVVPDQTTLNLARQIGASSAIVYERDLLSLFKAAEMKTYWWSIVADPLKHPDQPKYMEWIDLRSESVRQDVARWAVQIPQEADGGLSLDYIRWNQVGSGRTADQVTDLVRRIRANWNALGNGPLSAAVYPNLGQDPSDGGALSVGQKWNEWLKDGLLDFAYPMAYESKDIPQLIKEWESYDWHRIIPCLSVIDFH